MKKQIRTIISVTVLLLMAGAVTGCALNPMEDYAMQLEDMQIIDKITQTNNSITSLNNNFMQSLDVITVDGLAEIREMTGVLVDDVKQTISEVQGITTDDPTVIEANSYLVDYFSYLKDGINEFFVMIDAMIELKEIEEDLGQTDLEERLDDIIKRIESAETDAMNYLSLGDESLNKWQSLLEAAN